jgi:hypothetical protein
VPRWIERDWPLRRPRSNMLGHPHPIETDLDNHFSAEYTASVRAESVGSVGLLVFSAAGAYAALTVGCSTGLAWISQTAADCRALFA